MPSDLLIIEHFEKELGIKMEQINEIDDRDYYRNYTYIMDGDQNITGLKIRHLKYNLISNLLAIILNLKNLTWLNLRYNNITELPTLISNLHNLKHLNFGYNGLEILPPEIGELSNLEVLILSGNPLSVLPPEISKLKSLKELRLRETKLSKLPPEISDLQCLKSLDLRGIQWSISLTQALKPIEGLKNLTDLKLSGCVLTHLPTSLAELKSLTNLYLDLSIGKWTKLPPELSQIPNITGLDLSGIQLGNLPKEIIEMTQLRYLTLKNTELNNLPPEFAMLQSLTYLNLTANRLNALPEEIAELQNLETLLLTANNFNEFPSVILQLKNLNVLGFPNNKLKALPEEINKLVKLKELNLNGNDFSHIPPTLAQLKDLRALKIEKNPLEQPPLEIVKQGTEAVLEYLRHLLTKTTEHTEHNEAKMILVGQGDVGKTCLAKRLIFDTFQKDKSTEGIDILRWEIPAPTTEQEPINLNIWDFGGQEIYHATHQFFLTKKSLYLLIWNARKAKDYEHIYYWLHTIEAFGENSPVILVMTKRNERDDDLNMKDLREKFPQIVGLYKVDSEDGSGFEDLKNIIRNTAWDLPHMRTPWIKSWFRVRERLEKDARHWVEYREFEQICIAEGLDKKQTDILDEYLHDLGVIIHFRDNLNLINMVILKPDWATKAVYKILDAKPVREREGILLHRELNTIWDTDIYPPAFFPNLMELMSEFELAYQLPDKQSHLVAELLPSTEPDFPWDQTDNLCFYYNYDFLPAGFITRFIVLMHPYLELKKSGNDSDTHLCWREGCVLFWENTRALVRVRKVEKLTEIRIQGRKKREMLAIIRNQFGHINSSIKKIKFTQEIPCNCSSDCSQRYDYEKLVQAENLEKQFVQCQNTWKDISLSVLLDGYEKKIDRNEYHIRTRDCDKPAIYIQGNGKAFFGNEGRIDLSEREYHMNKQEKVINIGSGATISAPIVIADTIENSFNTLRESSLNDDIKQLLDRLLVEINEVNKKIPQDKVNEAETMVRDAETLVKEATSSKPRRQWYKISLDGLKETATSIGAIATPILDIVTKLAPLLVK